MQKQDDEKDKVEVGDRCVEAGRKTPSEAERARRSQARKQMLLDQSARLAGS